MRKDYCIQGKISPRLIFAPFALVDSGANLRLDELQYSYYSSLNTNLSRRIQDTQNRMQMMKGENDMGRK